MSNILKLILPGLLIAYTAQAERPHYYTDVELAARWEDQVHPGEKPRGDGFIRSIRRGGFYVGCGAALAAYANEGLGKVFHEHVIGATLVRFDLDANRPRHVRFGSFSDDVPQSLWGVGAFTSGRDRKDPNELDPDVTGLGVALLQDDVWVPWSSTASRAAFARRGVNFARLTGWPAIVKMALGFMSPGRLLEAHQGRSQNLDQPDNGYRQAPGWFHRVAINLGRLMGEGAFIGADPAAGLGTLVPAVLSGRRSPFPGFSEVGYGTDTRLLTESVPLERRQAFRLSFKLADNETNRKLMAEIPGWFATFENNLRGTPSGDIYPETGDEETRLLRRKHLTAQFNKWMHQKGVQIEYDVFMQLDDPQDPASTPIELAHRGWYSEKIRVGTLTLHSFGPRPELGRAINEFANGMHLSPGAGFHMPVGDLAWYRSVGRVLGRRDRPATVADTKDGTRGTTAVGAYAQSRDLRVAPDVKSEIDQLKKLFAEAGIEMRIP